MNVTLIGIGLVAAFCLWKFVIQPVMNADKPIEPPKDYKTIGEQMEEAVKTATDSVNTDVDF